MEEKVLIEAKNLKKYFKVGANSQLHAVDGVNFIKVKDDSISSYGINQVGIFIDPKNNAQPVSLSLVHWEEG